MRLWRERSCWELPEMDRRPLSDRPSGCVASFSCSAKNDCEGSMGVAGDTVTAIAGGRGVSWSSPSVVPLGCGMAAFSVW